MIPVAKTKTGYSKQSKMISGDDFEALLTYADKKTIELQNRMRSGESEASPYEMGQMTECDYCEFHNICGFDASVPGYQYRRFRKASAEEVMAKIRMDIQGKTEGVEEEEQEPDMIQKKAGEEEA